MNLQPLFDVKERLEYAAVAGVSLLGEDFRLQRAAEGLKPLVAASPVFGKIDAGLAKLLSAPPDQRPGLLLDVLALVDAVAYTQAKTGLDGELEPLPTGGGRYYPISYGQIQPLLTALTTTGGGRVEAVKSAWDRCPDYFLDYRILPVLIGALGDSYSEMAELCAALLKKLGPSVVPMLKKGFDPAGKREMARRVELIAALEGETAAPWLKEVLPQAKKDVRAAVITALGAGDEAILLLDLAKSERGKNRDAALEALAKQDGEAVAAFWSEELAKNSASVRFLNQTQADWASDLVARGLWDAMAQTLDQGGRVSKDDYARLWSWWTAAKGKFSPSMLDLWRWTDARMADIDKLQNHTGQPLRLGGQLTELMLDSLCQAGPGTLCGLCLELWETHKKEARWLSHAVVASVLTRPAADVYDTFSPYVPTIKPLLGIEEKKAFHNGVLKGLWRVTRDRDTGAYLVCGTWPATQWPAAQPLDKRWFKRLTHAVWKTPEGGGSAYRYGEKVEGFDTILMKLVDASDPEIRRELTPYLRQRMKVTGQYQTYSRWLFELGGSPQGVFKDSILKNGRPAYLYYIWELLNDAAKSLTLDETANLCQEVLDANYIRKEDASMALKVLPWTIQQLRAGRPFPEWNDWWNMRQ